ncbi:MAG: cyclic nucleotide-binding domain-containing protein [Actinobacteria bacterium]|nr:MAG: cyclic nucleotide-binding domain-containing protein [Actinomycetota bacterium]
MRVESSVTSISWIPSEAVRGALRVPFDIGVMHYDDPPPDQVDDLEALRAAGAFRFANVLSAWIEVENGRVANAGYSGGGVMGLTKMSMGRKLATFPAVGYPDLRGDAAQATTHVTFTQTAGGRAPIAAPRRVRRPPFWQLTAPPVWTTLALTVRADGTSSFEVKGASAFPRHWIYDDTGALVAKVGLADFKDWYRKAFGKYSPWGKADTPAIVSEAETALERELSTLIMRGGAKPTFRKLKKGTTLTEQGAPGDELYLLLDGVLTVETDGKELANVGPGAILGERALLEGGTRTATLRAVTPCRVAVADQDQIDPAKLAQLRESHRREEAAN